MTKEIKINDEELNAVEKEAEVISSKAYVHEFNEPFTYEGKTYEKLTFDWYSLTGNDYLAIENEMTSQGKPVIAPELSGEFLTKMAARACTDRVGADLLSALPFGDFHKIRGRARSFLLRSGQ